MKKNLLILTTFFPYEGGEQFFEPEVKYWENSSFDNIYILPSNQGGRKREFSKNIKIIDKIISKNIISNFYYMVFSLFTIIFWKELKYILLNVNGNIVVNLFYALKSTANTYRYKNQINLACKELEGEIYIYSYWNDTQCYGACLLKKEKKVIKVMSRAHGFDIYVERRVNNYMPLKWQFKDNIDKIFLLSHGAKKYFYEHYSYPREKLVVSRLGVEIPNLNQVYSIKENTLRILSLSYCVPIKRIDKILKCVEVLSNKYKDLYIEWTHIGGGFLFEPLKIEANKLTENNLYIKIKFTGELQNQEVKNYLANNNFDIFINTSESEGVPVSIMEAMSYGIPVIAPDIGGISSLVDNNNGYLISEKAEIHEILLGIDKIFKSSNISYYRENSRRKIINDFSAEQNFSNHISMIDSLTKIH